MRLDLTGKWQFKATDEQQFLSATVPGCQWLDLMDNGIIDDPFVGVNERKYQWVNDKDYEYAKKFKVSAENINADKIELVCKRLDTICVLFINDKIIGEANNCHNKHEFNIKEYLKVGENAIKIVFKSCKKYVSEKYAEIPTPVNSNGQNGIVHVRKPQCHFGWDWGPILTPIGIADDIYIDFIFDKKIGDLNAKAVKTEDGYIIFAHCDNCDKITLKCPNGETYFSLGADAEFKIDNPMLWWTYELSGKKEQPLYTVTAEMTNKNAEHFDVSKRLGLRTIELNRERDEYGRNFQFFLNGVPIFAKGANYIPPDSFATRFDKRKLNDLLDAVIFSNMNMIRVWGGGYYADDALLDECDRRGILIWQDFMFACQAYPFFLPDFLDNVLAEVKYNVSRISSHPCLAIWCGNNEIEAAHYAWIRMSNYIEWTEKFFYHILPDTIKQYDDVTPYTPGSPVGTAHNKNVNADFAGDTHLWAVWHGLKPMKYYRKRMTRFCSEYGFESLPCFSTLKTYAKPNEYDLSGEVQKLHQKCFGGNDKMLYYIATRFYLSDDIENLIYLSQITQQECIADATEHWRRNKGRCNGSLYWQLNDCWQTCSWSSYDYLGGYKALQYKAKDFNAPLSVSIEDGKKEIRLYVLNDLTEEKDVEVEYVIFSFDGTYSVSDRRTIKVEAVKNELAFCIPNRQIKPREQGLAVRLFTNGELVMQKTHLMLPEKKLNLPKSDVNLTTEIVDNKLRITLSSSVYQRLVMVENDNVAHFSDNYFDLLPNEIKVIEQPYDGGSKDIKIRSVATLSRTKKIKNLFARIKVFLSFQNISNYLYNSIIPKQSE